MRLGRPWPAYESGLPLGMFAVGTIPVVFFTIVAMASLSGALAGDVASRTATQLEAARTILDQERGRLADLARTYAEWPHLLEHLEARDLAGARADILDFQVGTGLADGSLLALGLGTVGSGDPALLTALQAVPPGAGSAYLGFGGGVYEVAVAPVTVRAGATATDRLVMALRIDAAEAASLRSATGWEIGLLSASGALSTATSTSLITPLGEPFDSGSISSWDGQVARGALALPGADGRVAGYLAIATPADRFASLPGRVAALLAAVVVATLVGAIVLAGILGRILDRRARRVEAALGAIEAGDLSVRLPEGPTGSLERLAGSHNRLAALLERREDSLRSLADALDAVPADAELAVIAGTGLRALEVTVGIQAASIIDEEGRVLGEVGPHATSGASGAPAVEVSLAPALPGARLVVVPAAGRALTPWDRSVLQLAAGQLGSLIRDARILAGASRRADDLDRLARLQSNFLRGVSHNLNGPLTSIQMLAEDLADQPRPDLALERAQAIAGETGRLRRLVEELLVMARLDAGTLQLSLTPFAPVPVLRRIWASQQSQRPFRIEDESGGRLVVADRAAFEQVAWMLLDNALTYAPDGPITVRLEPARAEPPEPARADDAVGPGDAVGDAGGAGERLRITVSDTGPGVPQEERELIFHRFQRGSTSDGTKGTGLGLDVARGLLAAMDGRIWCEGPGEAGPGGKGRPTTGAVFVMTLPAEEVSPA